MWFKMAIVKLVQKSYNYRLLSTTMCWASYMFCILTDTP